jgi:hypothetical protein
MDGTLKKITMPTPRRLQKSFEAMMGETDQGHRSLADEISNSILTVDTFLSKSMPVNPNVALKSPEMSDSADKSHGK